MWIKLFKHKKRWTFATVNGDTIAIQRQEGGSFTAPFPDSLAEKTLSKMAKGQAIYFPTMGATRTAIIKTHFMSYLTIDRDKTLDI